MYWDNFNRKKRTILDKLNTWIYGKDLRVTEGEVYSKLREGDYSSYYPLEKYIDLNQALPANYYDITEFGASTGKSDKENTPAIQSAIDTCAKNGGGTVLVRGGNYTVTTIELRSNIVLHIAKDSALTSNLTGIGYHHNALIYAKNCENITITGSGKIIGNGTYFGRKPIIENQFSPAPVIDVVSMRQNYRAQLRFAHPSKYGSLLVTDHCKNVSVKNIILQDSASWTYKVLCCNNVHITNTVIWNNRNVANADGFDITGSSHVTISHCFVSTADDGIVLKNANWCGCDGPMEDISIKDCEVISRTNAFKIGTETTYDISKILVEDCNFLMTDLYPGSVSGISIEACDGSKVHDITIRRINMNRCTCPVFIRLGNRNRAAEVTAVSAHKTEIKIDGPEDDSPMAKEVFDGKSELYHVHIEDITATDIEIPVIIAGYKEKGKVKYCSDITLKNFDLTYRDAIEVYDKRLFIPEYVNVYPEGWRFRNLPAYGLWARHCKNLNLENFKCTPVKKPWRKEIILKDVI